MKCRFLRLFPAMGRHISFLAICTPGLSVTKVLYYVSHYKIFHNSRSISAALSRVPEISVFESGAGPGAEASQLALEYSIFQLVNDGMVRCTGESAEVAGSTFSDS